MPSTFFRAFNGSTSQLYKLGADQSVTQWTAIDNLTPVDLTEFNRNVWFGGNTATQGNQLYKLGFDGSVTKWTAINTAGGGLQPIDLTDFSDALWFNGTTPTQGRQLYKLGNDGSVTQWTAIGADLNPFNLTLFNNALWFSGFRTSTDVQLYKLGSDGSVTQWTAIFTGLGVIGGGLAPVAFSQFNGALWFGGLTANLGYQLYKLGFDGSVTQWTDNPAGLNPRNITEFDGNAWFTGTTGGALGTQLYKLGFDGSVTQWTAINNLNPDADGNDRFTTFNDALWFNGNAPGQGGQLYKLGNDGSVTKWTALNTAGVGLNPQGLFTFANALWFNGQTASGGQLFKLGADGSVTQWTAVPGGFDPQLVSQAAFDPDSTPSSIFENAAWLQGTNAANGGTELYKLGADGSLTLWKDINPGPGGSFPADWARFA